MTRHERRAEHPPIDDRITRPIVQTPEAGLSRFRTRPVRVRELRREFSRSSSTFHQERLRVLLDGDKRALGIFFKHLRPEHQVTDARARHAISGVLLVQSAEHSRYTNLRSP